MPDGNGIESFRAIDAFRGARSSSVPSTRLEDVRKRARAFRDTMLSGNKALFYKTCELVRVPYPTRYAFANVYTQRPVSSPVLHITNRLFVIQFRSSNGIKTLLFSPSDVLANAETRYFKRLGADKITKLPGPLKTVVQKFAAPQGPTVIEHLEKIGIRPEDVDYLSYDHLHTQDLRNWLASSKESDRPVFPNAKLLIMRQEWESASGLLPPQSDWYCPNGTQGIDPKRVMLLDDDVMLGEGVALVRTPGHTMGNHSLVVHTDDGVLVTSENGVCLDNYSPGSSSIASVRSYAKRLRLEVILNGNTQESSVEQYISMVMEKEIAGPSIRSPELPNIVPSSEFTPWWLFRGIAPTRVIGDLEFGSLQRR